MQTKHQVEKSPFFVCSNNNQDSYCLKSCNWRKRTIEINTWLLNEISNNQLSFVLLNFSDLIEFNFANPFLTYNLFFFGYIMKLPSIVFLNHPDFVFHSFLPNVMLYCLLIIFYLNASKVASLVDVTQHSCSSWR